DSRTDRATRHEARRFVHVEKACVFNGLSGGVDAINDKGIDLPLDLVIHALVGIEPILVVSRLHLTSDAAFLVRSIEMGNCPGPAPRGENVGPTRLDVTPQGSNEPQPGYDYAAHLALRTQF